MGSAGSQPSLPGAVDLLSCHYEDKQRTGAALVCYRGINMQASVKQLFPVPINLMRGNVFLHALHLTQAQVISGRQIELRFVT